MPKTNMEKPAELVSQILKSLYKKTEVGISLLELNMYAEELCKELGVKSANKGYKPKWNNKEYQYVLCTSVNEAVSHGIPTTYVLKDGDIVTVDIGIEVDGLFGDSAFTKGVGEVSNRDERLMLFARRATMLGCNSIEPGISILEIGNIIGTYVMQMGYVTSQIFAGHFIGKEMHVDPMIPMYAVAENNLETFKNHKLKVGDVVCIEPHLTHETAHCKMLKDGWTVVTRDGKRSAMYEHMVEVTKTGSKILTNHFYETMKYNAN